MNMKCEKTYKCCLHKKIMARKAQVTLFVIIGILVVASIGGYFIISKGSFDSSKTSAKKFPEINPLVESCFIETNPIPTKYMLYKMQKIKTLKLRLPLVELTEQSKEKVNNVLKSYNLI